MGIMVDTKRSIYLCDNCGRQVRPTDEEIEWWLISAPPLAVKMVVRCPQHITDWSMRQAGIPRTRRNNKCAREAKKQDTGDRIIPEINHPYPVHGPWEAHQ